MAPFQENVVGESEKEAALEPAYAPPVALGSVLEYAVTGVNRAFSSEASFKPSDFFSARAYLRCLVRAAKSEQDLREALGEAFSGANSEIQSIIARGAALFAEPLDFGYNRLVRHLLDGTMGVLQARLSYERWLTAVIRLDDLEHAIGVTDCADEACRNLEAYVPDMEYMLRIAFFRKYHDRAKQAVTQRNRRW